MEFDYFYGQEAQLFSFYKVPKVLYTEECFADMTSNAKILYSILLDRMNLSAKNSWFDEEGRVFIIFTIHEIVKSINCSERKAVQLMNELEGIGLIERKKQGLCKPNLIYVKNFISVLQNVQFRKCRNYTSRGAENACQETQKMQSINTEMKKPDYEYRT